MLEIQNLHASIDGIPILKGVNLTIQAGEIHAIMGPNGAGKSTLAKILAGHPAYQVSQGKILFFDQDVVELDPEERACLGLFMGFQYPPEIPGVTNSQFLFHAYNSIQKGRQKSSLSEKEFEELLNDKMKWLEMKSSFKERAVNEGFSGGEKKRNEILQMAILEPKLAVLDETDSGLDIDAMRTIASGISHLIHQKNALLLITHYQRLLDYVKPHFVHIFSDGKIVKSGDASLALKVEEKGYACLLTS